MRNQKRTNWKYIVEKITIDGKVHLVARKITPTDKERYTAHSKQARVKPTSKGKGVVAIKSGAGAAGHGRASTAQSSITEASYSASKSIASFLRTLTEDSSNQMTSTLLSEPLESIPSNQISCIIGNESSPNEIGASELIDIVSAFDGLAKAVFSGYEVEGELTVKVAPFQSGCFIINFIVDVSLYLDPTSANALEIATNVTHIANDVIQTICAVIVLLAPRSQKSKQCVQNEELPHASEHELKAQQACENPCVPEHLDKLVEATMAAAGEASRVEFRWSNTAQSAEGSIIIERESGGESSDDADDGSEG